MPKLADKTNCCGCSACANKCAKGAIVMTPDEGGFLNPVVNNSLCVECGLCEKACPAIGPTSEPTAIQRAYLIQHEDETIRRQSTSGGAFTAIAQSIIDEGGIVYGACMKDGMVFHIGVEKTEDLALFRNSKYVQSDMKGAFKEVKAHLAANRSVCFSGTPCQIAGLKYYLGKNYENLLTVDVVCHAIPSPYIFERYVELTKKRLPNAQKLVFRDKKRGYSYSTMAWYDVNGKNIYRASYEIDEWYRLFLHDKCDRSSCYACKYQNQPRMSDITIWDCYNAHDLCPEMDDNKGTTNVIVWTEKGLSVLDKAKHDVRCKEIDVRLTIKAATEHKRERPEWDEATFYKDAHDMQVEDFFNKYVPRTFKAHVASMLRYLLWRVGLHDTVRRIIQKRRS